MTNAIKQKPVDSFVGVYKVFDLQFILNILTTDTLLRWSDTKSLDSPEHNRKIGEAFKLLKKTRNQMKDILGKDRVYLCNACKRETSSVDESDHFIKCDYCKQQVHPCCCSFFDGKTQCFKCYNYLERK